MGVSEKSVVLIIVEVMGGVPVENMFENKGDFSEVSNAGYKFTEKVPGLIVSRAVVIQETF
jgi:hypothetical protein